jgi:hypothetical protein
MLIKSSLAQKLVQETFPCAIQAHSVLAANVNTGFTKSSNFARLFLVS